MTDKKISQLTGATTPLTGTEVLPIVQSGSTVKVSIDDLTAGKTVKATTFDTDVAAAGVTLTGTTLAADGTDTNIDISITPKGTGEVNLTKVDIDGGAIDGTTVGASSAAAGTFTNATGDSYRLSSSGIITESTTSRTLGAGDNGKIIYCTSGSATTITTASGLGAGFSCLVIQGGAGQITVAQGSSTTLVALGAAYKTAGQYAAISIISPVADTFVVAGSITA